MTRSIRNQDRAPPRPRHSPSPPRLCIARAQVRPVLCTAVAVMESKLSEAEDSGALFGGACMGRHCFFGGGAPSASPHPSPAHGQAEEEPREIMSSGLVNGQKNVAAMGPYH